MENSPEASVEEGEVSIAGVAEQGKGMACLPHGPSTFHHNAHHYDHRFNIGLPRQTTLLGKGRNKVCPFTVVSPALDMVPGT